jgi:hypothetical protein
MGAIGEAGICDNHQLGMTEEVLCGFRHRIEL